VVRVRGTFTNISGNVRLMAMAVVLLTSILLFSLGRAQATNGFDAIPVAFLARTPWFSIQGPALQAFGNINFAAQGPNGEIYFTRGELGHDGASPGVWVLDNGRIHCLLCNEGKGYRDGPAAMALFDPRGQEGYGPEMDVAVNKATGDLFLADGWNHRIRKVSKATGAWMVSTFAGGGSVVMQPGQDYNATDVDLPVYVAVTVDGSGNVWTTDNQGQLYRITPSGTVRVMAANYTHISDVVDMDTDTAGNVYLVVRGSVNQIAKYSTDGVLAQFTGTDTDPQHRLWDGPIATAKFNCPSFIAVAPDGNAMYVGGGDENTIRRIKYAGSEWRVSTLQENGTWNEWLDFESGKGNGGGWNVGSPRFVDANGDLYIAYSLYISRPFSRIHVGS
jgi:hypothetical protein